VSICSEKHLHEKSEECYDKHGCRCSWCSSEARARRQEKGVKTEIEQEEINYELQFFISQGFTKEETLKLLGIKVGK
jgi:hypothetical protein